MTKEQIVDQLREDARDAMHRHMLDQLWPSIDLTPSQADGLACVVCEHEYADRAVVARPVGRSRTGSQVFACNGECLGAAVLRVQAAARALEIANQ